MLKKFNYHLAIVVVIAGMVNSVFVHSVMAQQNKVLFPFTAILTGGQEVPGTESKAFGVAFVTFETESKMLCYSINFTDDKLAGTETVAHFHGPAIPGEVADVLFTITPSPSPPGNPKNGCVGPLSLEQRRQLGRGLFYINIHSELFPEGEIRGQVLPVRGIRFNTSVNEGK
ncbi:MAG: CHRD domain-containing protein [Candidatus Jettenia sp.]|nr:CHRD domain-containing protein [Candidatus Jettenia sp.]